MTLYMDIKPRDEKFFFVRIYADDNRWIEFYTNEKFIIPIHPEDEEYDPDFRYAAAQEWRTNPLRIRHC